MSSIVFGIRYVSLILCLFAPSLFLPGVGASTISSYAEGKSSVVFPLDLPLSPFLKLPPKEGN